MKHFTFLSVAAACLLSACSTAHWEPKGDPTRATLSGEACPTPQGGGYLYTFETLSLQVGETLTLQPYFSTHPGSVDPLPAGCVGGLSASPVDAINWSRLEDGTAIATVTDKAVIGDTILLQTNYAGAQSISQRITIYEQAANPLIGFWSQIRDEACPSEAQIKELVFSADGSFSVTWTPFETYKDYWGRYDYDMETGILTLTPQGGNHLPETLQSGKIRLEDGVLIPLEGMSFGENSQGMSCTTAFKGGR